MHSKPGGKDCTELCMNGLEIVQAVFPLALFIPCNIRCGRLGPTEYVWCDTDDDGQGADWFNEQCEMLSTAEFQLFVQNQPDGLLRTYLYHVLRSIHDAATWRDTREACLLAAQCASAPPCVEVMLSAFFTRAKARICFDEGTAEEFWTPRGRLGRGWYFNGEFQSATAEMRANPDRVETAQRFSTAFLRALWPFNDAYALMCAKSDLLKDGAFNDEDLDTGETRAIADYYGVHDEACFDTPRGRRVLLCTDLYRQRAREFWEAMVHGFHPDHKLGLDHITPDNLCTSYTHLM